MLFRSRITSVYDPDRTGALYLTASDQEAPFMDVIDGLVSDNALTYPTSINKFSYVDPVSQYVVQNQEYVDAEYIASQQDVRRICKMTTTTNNLPVKIKQDFSKYIQNTDRILVSYRIKSNNNFCNVVGKIGYSDGTLIDGEWVDEVTDEWKYVLRIVQAGHSGRYLRSFELGCDELSIGDSLCIADLSVVLLSDVANFTQSTKSRIGKLDGVRDSVFGKLSGYGAYIPRLYATKSVNIAGTLAAGDEDGVGATFYAGKIRSEERRVGKEC